MADFSKKQEALTKARAKREEAKIQLALVRNSLFSVLGKLHQLHGRASVSDPEFLALKQESEDLFTAQRQLENEYNAVIKEESAAYSEVLSCADMQGAAIPIDDQFPVFLAPVRLETRFVEPTAAAEKYQLLIRIYPEECSVESFEPGVSENEQKSLQRYWDLTEISGVNDELKSSAWQEVTKHYGNSRASVLLNKVARPKEETAAKEYWKKVWQAKGNTTKEQAAWNDLVKVNGSARAKFLKNTYTPINYGKGGQVFWSQMRLLFPRPKLERWTQAPRTLMMPDRFLAYLYQDNQNLSNPIIVKGNPVLDDLSVGPNPTAGKFISKVEDQRIQFQQAVFTVSNGDIEFDEASRWMVDFDEAVRMGMGLKIPLEQLQYEKGFARIIVVGVKASVDPGDSQGRLQALITNHLESLRGFSFLPQDVPTNLVEGIDEDMEDIMGKVEERLYEKGVFNSEGKDDTLREDFKNIRHKLEKKDSEYFAEALGIEPSILMSVPGNNKLEISDALAMNFALWPATIGCYFADMFYRKNPVDPKETNDENIGNITINEKALQWIRTVFCNFITGRGLIPNFRIGKQPYGIIPVSNIKKLTLNGKDKPYVDNSNFLKTKSILQNLDEYWEAILKNNVSNINNGTDRFKNLLNILGLNPTSASFYGRYGLSYSVFKEIANNEQFIESWNKTHGQKIGDNYFLDEDFFDSGYWSDLTGEGIPVPVIFDKVFQPLSFLLNGNLIDKVKLSEIDGIIKDITIKDQKANYLEWFIHNGTTITDIMNERFESSQNVPNTLLYLLTRFSVLMGYWHVATKIFPAAAEKDDPDDYEQLKRIPDLYSLGFNFREKLIEKIIFEPDGNLFKGWDFNKAVAFQREDVLNFEVNPQMIEFFQKIKNSNGIASEVKPYGSQYEGSGYTKSGYKTDYPLEGNIITEPHIFTSRDTSIPTIADYLSNPGISNIEAAADLNDLLFSIRYLCELSTSRLARAFAEHVDLCSYRIDAWKTGLVNMRLSENRFEKTERGVPNKGLYLGAFGWLENVRPRKKESEPVSEEETNGLSNIKDVSCTKGDEFIHTPSLNHALTSALLRNGYMSSVSSGEVKEASSVNISSKRTRAVLKILEGARQGISLGANLGYLFERAIHDTGLDYISYALRDKFPMIKTKDKPGSNDKLDVGNVFDGLKFLNYLKANKTRQTYPFGYKTKPYTPGNLLKEDEIYEVDAPKVKMLNQAVKDLLGALDAVNDVLFAEGIFNMGQGNYEKAYAALNVISQGKTPPEIGVTEFPRSGNTINHRVAVQWSTIDVPNSSAIGNGEINISATSLAGSLTLVKALTDYNIAANPFNGQVYFSPRAIAEPGLNYWLSKLIGSPKEIFLCISYTSQKTLEKKQLFVKCSDFDLQPVDLVYASALPPDNRGSEFSKKAQKYLDTTLGFSVYSECSIAFSEYDTLEKMTKVDPKIGDTKINAKTIFEVFPLLDHLRLLLAKSRSLVSSDLIPPSQGTKIETIKQEINIGQLKIRVNLLMADFMDRVLSLDEAIKGLNLVSGAYTLDASSLTKVFTGHFSGAQMQNVNQRINNLKKTNVINLTEIIKWNNFIKQIYRISEYNLMEIIPTSCLKLKDSILKNPQVEINNLQRPVRQLLTQLSVLEEQISALEKKVSVLKKQQPLKSVTEEIASSYAQITLCYTQLVQILLGKDFKSNASFNLQNKFDFIRAFQTRNQIIEHLPHPFPMEEWLHGIARVRPNLEHLEHASIWSENFGQEGIDLSPIQLPFQTDDKWLGMEFPSSYKIQTEKLLYTFCSAHVPGTALEDMFDKSQEGILIDQWTETIPEEKETTGVALRFDRPTSQPPQAFLLAVSPTRSGTWLWEDLEASIHEALNMAKKRAVEPGQLAETELSQLLPAIMTASSTLEEDDNQSISSDLYRNIANLPGR